MATRRPLVLNDGLVSELLDGDTVRAGTSTTEVVAGSGLTGGGSVSTNPELDLALAPNPSGIIYVGDALGIDGAAGVTADIALASGSAAAVLASNALASGNNSLVVASAALASGNAALDLVPTLGGGGGGTVVELTAASAVASGYAVGFDDGGKVQSVRSAPADNTNPMSFPSPAVVYESTGAVYNGVTYDSSNNRVVVAYQDQGNSGYGTAVVGTITGTSVSFGTPVVFESGQTYNENATFDSTNNKVVIGYRDDSNGGTNYTNAIVGTVSGSTISFGSPTVFDPGVPDFIACTFDTTNSKVCIAYQDFSNSGYGTAIVGTVSGTSITFGAAVVFRSAVTRNISACFDSTNSKVVIGYVDQANSSRGTAIVATISGTSISYGASVVFETGSTTYTSCAYDVANNRVVIFYTDTGNSSYGTAVVGTVSGTSISFGTPVVADSTACSYNSITFDSNNNKLIISYSSGFGTAKVGTVSGTTIAFGSPAIFQSTSITYLYSTYDSVNDRFIAVYADAANGNNGTAIVADALLSTSYNPTINSYPNVLGIAQSTVASGSPCLVNLPGTLYNEPAANLTTGAFYYADPTTSGITTTSTQPTSWNGQVPWNYIGRAVTSSGLMLLKSI